MIVRITASVFLYIIRIRFPAEKLVAYTIRNRYGEIHVRKIPRYEKCDFKLRKFYSDLKFLSNCKKNDVFPKFLHFELSNRHLKNSYVHKECQIRLLEGKIKPKRAKSDYWKEKSNQSESELIPWERMYRGLRKN